MRILVAGDIVPSPESLRWVNDSQPDFSSATYIPDPFFEGALEAAHSLAAAMGASVCAVVTDPSGSEECARFILATGVHEMVRVSGPLLLDPLSRAEAILRHAPAYDVIFTGWDSLISPSAPLGPFLSHLSGTNFYGPVTISSEGGMMRISDWFSGAELPLAEGVPCTLSIRGSAMLRYPTLEAALSADKFPLKSLSHDMPASPMPLTQLKRVRLLPGNAAEAVIEILNERGMFEL